MTSADLQAFDRDKFQEQTEEELRREILRRRQSQGSKAGAAPEALAAPSSEAFLDGAGVPEPLRRAVKRPVLLTSKEINMQHPSSFSPRPGAKIKTIAARSVVTGALENCGDPDMFLGLVSCTFLYFLKTIFVHIVLIFHPRSGMKFITSDDFVLACSPGSTPAIFGTSP